MQGTQNYEINSRRKIKNMRYTELTPEINERIHNRLMLVPELTKASITGVRLNELGTQVYRALTFVDIISEDELGEINNTPEKTEPEDYDTEDTEDVFNTDESKETLMKSLMEIFGLDCTSGTEYADMINKPKIERTIYEDTKSIDVLDFITYGKESSRNIAQAIERLRDVAEVLRDPDTLDIKSLNIKSAPTTYLTVSNSEKLWNKLMSTIGYKGSANDFIDKLTAMGLVVKDRTAKKCLIDITEAIKRGIIQE